MIRRISLILWVFLLAGIVNFAQGADSPARPAKLIRMRLSQSTVNTRSAILWVAQAQGLFAKYGLEVETIFLQSSNLQTAALATNEVQIGNIGGATVLSGVAGGQTFRIIASPSNQLFYDLVARPDIKDGKDIRGKRIGVTSIGGTTWMAANLGLQHYGLDPSRDAIQINAIGNQSVLVQALESGSIDLAVLDPFLSRRLKPKGMKVLIEFAKVNIPFITTAVVTTALFLREHDDQGRLRRDRLHDRRLDAPARPSARSSSARQRSGRLRRRAGGRAERDPRALPG
jgi:ABC-type nitrate/sulfonate/bicarbonate transport system substrate-binding protein